MNRIALNVNNTSQTIVELYDLLSAQCQHKKSLKLRLYGFDIQWIQNLHQKLTSGIQHNNLEQQFESIEFTIIEFKWRKFSRVPHSNFIWAHQFVVVSVCKRNNSDEKTRRMNALRQIVLVFTSARLKFAIVLIFAKCTKWLTRLLYVADRCKAKRIQFHD